jgi:hypothetical protein
MSQQKSDLDHIRPSAEFSKEKPARRRAFAEENPKFKPAAESE